MTGERMPTGGSTGTLLSLGFFDPCEHTSRKKLMNQNEDNPIYTNLHLSREILTKQQVSWAKQLSFSSFVLGTNL